jgi:succinate dehydrogenase / fumarate reductase cytochrome b subunit
MFFDNQSTRPAKYEQKRSAGYTTRKSFASTTMIISGLWLLVFLVIHAKTFRDGWGHQYEWPAGGRDLYRQEMETFQNPLVVAFYVLTMAVVGSHLWHGLASALQSLGISHERWTPRFLVIGKALAVLIAGAFMAIAIWAYMRQAGAVHA